MPRSFPLVLLFLLSLLVAIVRPPAGIAQETVTRADVERWMEELSNWGRWGEDDQRGTLNLITPKKRREAAELVREGMAVSLARDVETESAVDNPRPFGHTMISTAADGGPFVSDTFTISHHGYAHTHLDSLAHMAYRGRSYNGFEFEEVTAEGAPHLDVAVFKDGVFTRGVLVDIPHLRGVEWLEPGEAIHPEDLDAWERATGLRISAGDIVFIRTGRWARRAAEGPWNVGERAAGLYAASAKWLHERDIAALGSDAASDVAPSGVEGVRQPIHQLFLIAMGTPIFDNCDLEAIAAACERRGRWEFLLTAAPLPVSGGTGSALNPIAVF